MSKRRRIALGVTGVLVVLLVAVILFFRYQIRKSFPTTSGTVSLSVLHDAVTVTRDSYGVPSITAGDEHDMMVAFGYVHAQDRLWQMDLARRAAEGRLSEIFGRETLPFDRMFRIVGIRRASEAAASSMPAEMRERLEWYAEGVNALIAEMKGRYPVEFDVLGYVPESWTAVNTLEMGRMMAWDLNLAWYTDLTYGILADRVGLQKAAELLPEYPRDVPPTVPQQAWKSYACLSNGFLRAGRLYAELFGSSGAIGGSNAWVVGPALSTTHNVILANDTHLLLQAPSRWYEVDVRRPGLHLRGMSIAGVPAVVAGRNDSIAWGVTAVMADDADFYVERVDPADPYSYEYDGGRARMTVFMEDIPVRKDTAEPLTIRVTHHGPIVSDISNLLHQAAPREAVSMRWTGRDPDDQFSAFYRINTAAGWSEFAEGVKRFPYPGQNFVFGDSKGNIGYWCGAKIPIRPAGNSIFPRPGWDPAAEWRGFVPGSQLPHLFNPPEGFIATANNPVVDDTYPYHIGDLWEPSSRIERLRSVLSGAGGSITMEECERLQTDATSLYAQRLIPYLQHALADPGLPTADRDMVAEYLRNWHGMFSKDDVASSIIQSWFVRLVRDTFEDEMGDTLFHDWTQLTNIPFRVTVKLLSSGTSAWFDDVRTPEVETRDDILRRALREALADLRGRLGEETKNWRWGELHRVTMRHPFGLVKPLDRVFNIGPFPADGGSTALVSNEYSLTDPFAVTVGASFRQVFDLGAAARVHSILPSGESGQVFHPHYRDQTALWLTGGMRSTSYSSVRPEGVETLILKAGP
jgi:penicillin G amidase